MENEKTVDSIARYMWLWRIANATLRDGFRGEVWRHAQDLLQVHVREMEYQNYRIAFDLEEMMRAPGR